MTEPEIKRIEVSSGEEQKRPEEKKSKKGRFFIFLVLLATATFLFYKFNPLDPTIAIKDNINLLKEKGIRDKVKIIVGGASVNQEFADSIGADGYAPEAGSAVEWAKKIFAKS